MQFEWDENKNAENIAKHGFDFEDAAGVFQTDVFVRRDARFDYSEERWIGIGLLNTKIIFIVFTQRGDDVIRVISLRKALTHERHLYEAYLQNRLEED